MPEAPHTNALADETSPYLLQHAHNPVDWRPWSDEAFDEAKRRDVPVFLSIGYSTCYWCHVMERECFENDEIAGLMNEHLVCVKVDREERPDIDEIYMAATTILTGSGGWPMSVFLDPQTRKPFYAGTYFPPTPMHNRPALPQLVLGLSQAWAERRGEVVEQAQQLAAAVIEQVGSALAPVALGRPQLSAATAALLTRLDRRNGGFSHAPKFPQPVFIDFLLDVRAAADGPTRSAIDTAVRTTLDAMAIGGLNDQVGGGFHRYSVDEFWTVPHFEKMLYDNAQLASTYARASVVYADPFYARTARRTLDFVLREMTGPGEPGSKGFYSAIDAEVGGREGLNYLWTAQGIEGVLGEGTEESAFAMDIYGVGAGTNFKDPHHPDEPGRNVLRLEARSGELAARYKLGEGALLEKLDAINARLLGARERRPQPRIDDKVLVSWNGLMIGTLVEAGDALNEPRYIEAARLASEFISSHMHSENGELLRTWRAGVAKVPAMLEDAAMLISGLIRLHASPSGHNKPALEAIIELADETHERFADEGGAYFDTRAGARDLFVRTRSFHDGALPSAAGVMLDNLIDLARLAPDGSISGRLRARAAALLGSISPALAASPVSTINSTRALLRIMTDHASYDGLYDFTAADTGAAKEPEPHASPVRVLASTDTIRVGDDSPASFRLALEIDPGHHIVAADPGSSEAAGTLHPFRVGLISGQGIAIYADYPDGDELGLDSVGKFNAYTSRESRIEFDVAIEKAPGIGASPGSPVLGVSFQACSENACLPPMTVRLDIAIEID